MCVPSTDKPSAPSSVTGVLLGSSSSVLISWLPPLSDGNSPITHYVLETRQIEYEDWELIDNEIVTAAHVIEGLLPGKSYLFRVASANIIGQSPFSKPSLPVIVTTDEGKECFLRASLAIF